MPLDQHLVLHLKEMYSTERDYRDFLNEKIGQISNQQLKSTVSSELDDIGRQMNNLRQALSAFGTFPDEGMRSPAVQALRQEDQMTMQELPSMNDMDKDAHVAMTDLSFGHSEIGKYQGMINMARVINRPEVVDLLQDNLTHEQQDVDKIQQVLSDIINQEWQQQQRAA